MIASKSSQAERPRLIFATGGAADDGARKEDFVRTAANGGETWVNYKSIYSGGREKPGMGGKVGLKLTVAGATKRHRDLKQEGQR